ncbi:hypothetical protein K7W03_14450 [Sphingobium sp. PNB]|uniref:hypothetical protein n=1 Tax=Sphingobium sp. PNB TaxID=863934 RepID=UPI001CA39F16|nr:hypothetical protein [Sphingobium sp. PNB]MCB4860792.1 hypothetical protein [Sphingobium sp. PNB]
MSKKSKSSTTPWKSAQPYLLGAANNLQGAYNDNAGAIQDATDSVTSLLPAVIQKYQQGNPALNAAQGYNTDVLSGKYLNGNPHLQAIIDNTNNDVTNSVQSSLGTRGLTGGSDYAKIIARELAKNESNLRYGDYSNERNAMATAAGQSPSLAAADTIQINPMLQLLGAYSTPLDAASQYASGVGGLFSPYSTTTQKSGLGNTLAALGGSALSAWAGGGFK